MTTLGPATDYTSSSPMVNQGQKKTFITNMRALIADRLGIGYNLAPENVASASNVDLSGINTRQINLTGTTQVDTVTAAIGLSVVVKATGAITLKAAVTGTGADILLASGDSYTWRATAADTMEVIGLVRAVQVSKTPQVRQAVQSCAIDANGAPNYLSIGSGLNVNLAATAVPVRLSAANGFDANGQVDRQASIVADTTVAVTDSATNYLYATLNADGTATPGATTVAPAVQPAGTFSTTSGKHVYNYLEAVGKVGNGSAAVQDYRVYLGEAVAAGGVVTSVVNYQHGGEFVGAWTASLPGATTQVSENHNFGHQEFTAQFEAECTTADVGFSVGDRVDLLVAGLAGTNVYPIGIRKRRLAVSIQTAGGSAQAFLIPDGTTGNGTSLTNASWKRRFRVQRRF